MPISPDLKGQRFGRLQVVTSTRIPLKRGIFWECLCDCGGTVYAQTGNLNQGSVQSCGCLQLGRHITHGKRNTPEFQAWANLLQRCNNPKNPMYHHYGGRGIRVCDRWRNSFIHFYEDMGPRPSPDHSIDRKDNDEGYSPENCRWATFDEQSANKRNNVYHVINGKRLHESAVAREYGIGRERLYARLASGCTIEEAIDPTKWSKQLYSMDGESKTLREWAIKTGHPYPTLYSRIVTGGWDVKKALTAPSRKGRKKSI